MGHRRLREATGATVLVVHHFGWDKERQRGSTALYGACDTVIYTERKGKSDVVKVWVDKQKDAPEGEEARFRWVPVELTGSGVLIPTVKDTDGEIDEKVLKAVLEYLATYDGVSQNNIEHGVKGNGQVTRLAAKSAVDGAE